jgi:hypothetical protein
MNKGERAPWHARMATTLYMPALGASLIIFALYVVRARATDAARARAAPRLYKRVPRHARASYRS